MGKRSAAAVVLAAVFLLSACGKVTDEYPTRADAAAAGLFEQAWLPDLMPPSASLIRITRSLDQGEAEGWFHFPSQDWSLVEAKLQPYRQPLKPDPAVTTWVAKKSTRGYTPFEVTGADARWLFVCSESGGKCYFKRWPAQSD